MGNKLRSPTQIGHLLLSDSSTDDYLYVQGNPITGESSIDLSDYVQKTQTIADIDLQDNITKQELSDALGISPDLNIKNGIGQFSLQQKISEDNIKNPRATGLGAIAFGGFRGDKPNGIPDEEDRSTVAEGIQSFAFGAGTYAHGNWSVAGGKDSDAYQQGSVVIGGACQAGMTEEEFDNYYGRVVQIGFIDRPEIYGEVLVPLYQNFHNVPIKLYRIDNYTGDAGQNSAELRYTDGRDIYIYYKVQWDEITSSIKGYSYAGTTPSIELSLTFIDDVLRPYASSYSQTFAVNSENKALGKYSSAFGSNTIAKHKAQLVGGMNNDNKEDTLLEIGNGTDKNNRSNAFEVTKDGVARAYGTVQGNNDLIPKGYADNNYAPISSSVMRANTWRGKNLGTVVTDEQIAAIRGGTFEDLFIGDFWFIGNRVWRIADMDYFYNVGDILFMKHHLVIIPDVYIGESIMNEDATTNKGYYYSYMRNTGLNNAKNIINSAFGNLVQTHRDFFTNDVSNGRPVGGNWYDSTVELMNEIMVYGCHIRAAMGTGAIVPTNYTTAKKQLSIFRLNPTLLNQRKGLWLRDIVSSELFAHISYSGAASAETANASNTGIYPYFIIG